MNSFGNIFRLTSFGESHGVALGGVIDGFPAGIAIDVEYINKELARRRPGQSRLTTARKESDEVEILSGVFEGKSTGTPIGFIIKNSDQRPGDYSKISEVYRPSHADYTYDKKYGFRDHRGGGRSSARETACRVVAGAFAKLFLKDYGIEITAFSSQIGEIKLDKSYDQYDLSLIEETPVRCPDLDKAQEMIKQIEVVRKTGDTTGGVVSAVIKGVPVGLGEPVFGKLHAALAGAMMSINATKGFEYGMGFDGVSKRGSEVNDIFIPVNGQIRTRTNNSGGIQGGISNGEDIYFRVAFKPVATVLQPIETVDKEGNPITFKATGRHDPCVVPRAVAIVEAMAAMVIMDYFLLAKAK